MTKYIVIYSFISCLFTVKAQKLNGFDKHGERHGRWLTYMDDEKKIKSFEGKFRHGKTVGKSYYYTNDGVLERIEINRRNKLKTTFYYPNAKVRLKGNARIDNLPDKVHYYYYGKWKAYTDSGNLLKYCYYNKGQLVKTVYLDKNNKTNDSLIDALNLIDKEFGLHNRAIGDSIEKYQADTALANFYRGQLHYYDSISFSRIEKIISVYGYPSRKLAADASVIPFYIIGFAPLTIREKYAEVFTMAMYQGDISPKSYAFFIDKLKIAQKKKQVYGTQFYYDKQNIIYYPSEDPENLNKRRESVGLEPLP